MERFIAAMGDAGISVHSSATFRPVARSYLMHWCWRIKHGTNAASAPAMTGIDIEWIHPTPAASLQAAKKMVKAFDMDGLKTAPALHFLHNEGRAIDMSIAWTGTVSIKDANGTMVELKTTPRTGMNRQLMAVGASYGVNKFLGGARDKPHWSATGR